MSGEFVGVDVLLLLLLLLLPFFVSDSVSGAKSLPVVVSFSLAVILHWWSDEMFGRCWDLITSHVTINSFIPASNKMSDAGSRRVQEIYRVGAYLAENCCSKPKDMFGWSFCLLLYMSSTIKLCWIVFKMTMCNFLAPCTSFKRHFTCFPESYNNLDIGFVDVHSERHIKRKCHLICVCWILCHSNDVIAKGTPLGTKTMFSRL